MRAWVESQHPRDEKGRFDEAGAGASSSKHAHNPHPTARVWTDKLPKGMREQTWMGHYDKEPWEGGVCTDPERIRLHEDIERKALDVKPAGPNEQKLAIMTMGAPASGKGAVLSGFDRSKFVGIDPDDIKAQLPEYKRATQDRANTYTKAAPMAHEESTDIAKEILAKAIKAGNHVIVDGTGMDADKYIAKIKTLQAAGYHVHVAMAHLDEEEGIKRLIKRADITGRLVPVDLARGAYKSIPPNFERISRMADSAALYDNSGADPRKVFETSKKGGDVVHDPAFMTTFRKRYGGKP